MLDSASDLQEDGDYDMVALMKTTIEIPDTLYKQARLAAREEGTTIRAVVEAALRRFLAERASSPGKPTYERHTFKGNGLHPGVDPSRWRDTIFEGRG